MYELIGEYNTNGWINALYDNTTANLEYGKLKITEDKGVATMTMPIITAGNRVLAIHNFNGSQKSVIKEQKLLL